MRPKWRARDGQRALMSGGTLPRHTDTIDAAIADTGISFSRSFCHKMSSDRTRQICPEQGKRCRFGNDRWTQRCGRRGTRTPDQRLVKPTLYRLSYASASGDRSLLVAHAGANRHPPNGER